jgi:hypothetical protein
MATVSRVDGFQIECLTGSNWTVWSMDVLSVLRVRKLAKTIATEDTDTDAANISQALGLISLLVQPGDKLMLASCETALEAWQLLEKRYKNTAKAAGMHLKRELASIQKARGESIDEYAARTRQLYMQLLSAGMKVDEDTAVKSMLSGLPAVYDSVVVPLFTDDEELTFVDVMPKLYVVEARELAEDVFPAMNLYMGARGKKTRNQRECWHCGQLGHFKANCPELKGKAVATPGGDKREKPVVF